VRPRQSLPEGPHGGRPPLEPGADTPRALPVRLTVALDTTVRQLAQQHGVSQADIVRRAAAHGIQTLAAELIQASCPGAEPGAALHAITRDAQTGAVRHRRCGCTVGSIVPAVTGTRGVRVFGPDGGFLAAPRTVREATTLLLSKHLSGCSVRRA